MIVVNTGRITDKTYFWTAKPLPPRSVPAEAVREKMMLEVDLRYVQRVVRVTKEEYCRHMYE
jgi:hypothetical protein